MQKVMLVFAWLTQHFFWSTEPWKEEGLHFGTAVLCSSAALYLVTWHNTRLGSSCTFLFQDFDGPEIIWRLTGGPLYG